MKVEPKKPATQKLNSNTARAVEAIKEQGRRVEIFGRMQDGKLEISSRSLDSISKGEFTFVAVNAPFDPVPCD